MRVDSTAKVAEIEHAEKEKMKEKVERILKHGINCFINRSVCICANNIMIQERALFFWNDLGKFLQSLVVRYLGSGFFPKI